MEVMVNLFLFSSSSYCISCLCPWYKEISVSLEKRNLQNKKTLFEDTFQNCFIEKNFGLKGTKYFMILSSGFEDNVDWITIAVTSKQILSRGSKLGFLQSFERITKQSFIGK